jgi:FtsP/CotA-like multicopper oxidase with cupredoxin domain
MMRYRSRLLVGAALLAAATGYAAAPPSAHAETPGEILGHVPSVALATSATIVIPNDAQQHGYASQIVVITQGGHLSAVNQDGIAHTVTSVATDSQGDALFDRAVAPGKTVTIPAASQLAPGTYQFYCRFHPNMRATLVVEGLLGGGSGGTQPAAEKFPQSLKLPKVLTGSHITIPVKQAAVRVLPTGKKTRMWTFDGSYPGPTIVRPAGHDTKVTFVNKLPKRAGSITVHLHGDHHPWQDDGQPDRFLIKRGARRTYDYPLTDGGKPETEATEFYHDHRMNETARNNWEGLQGIFLVRSKREKSLDLPSGKYDVPLLVSDRSFTKDNQLTNPFTGLHPTKTGFKGSAAPPGDQTVGNKILVDGRFAPHLNVAARRYRLRLINTSDFQSYDFALSDGQSFDQIGFGSDLLPHPVVRKDILLGPAQRADVVVNFKGQLHKNVLLQSIARTHQPTSGIGTPVASLMQFRVTSSAADHSTVRHTLRVLPKFHAPKPSFTWNVSLKGNAKTGTYWAINGKPFDPSVVDVEVPLGATRTWVIKNTSSITHYIHLHEEQWYTIKRDGKKPPAYERGLEDTWRLDPGESVEVGAKFTDYTGVFMLHCHMLNHEDDGMMAQFAVVPPGTHTLPAGYHLRTAVASSHLRTGSGMSMSMSTPGEFAVPSASTAAASHGWHRWQSRVLLALLAELLLLLGLDIGRRYVRIVRIVLRSALG